MNGYKTLNIGDIKDAPLDSLISAYRQGYRIESLQTCQETMFALITGKYLSCYTQIKYGAAPNAGDASYLCNIGVTNEALLQQWLTATMQQQGRTIPECTAAPPPTTTYKCTSFGCQQVACTPGTIGCYSDYNSCSAACTTVPPPSGGCTADQIPVFGSCLPKSYITYGALGLGAILLFTMLK